MIAEHVMFGELDLKRNLVLISRQRQPLPRDCGLLKAFGVFVAGAVA